MIDLNELRRLAQAATHPTTKGRWMRLFGERTVCDRLETGCRGLPVVSTPVHPPNPFEAASLDFIAAANPAAISELLDRLEAAESEAIEQARLNGMGAERELALMAKLEAAEKERDGLRAKIERMEKQGPVAWMGRGPRDGRIEFSVHKPSPSVMRDFNMTPIYALPGAQSAPDVFRGLVDEIVKEADDYERRTGDRVVGWIEKARAALNAARKPEGE